MFTGFNFSGGSGNLYCTAGFSNKTPSDGVAASVSCSYDGKAIPNDGYPFEGSVWLMLYTLVRADPLHRDLDQLSDLLVQAGEQVTGEV